MAQLARQTTWASLQTLTASNLNAEFDNIVNGWNNTDAGTNRWTVMDATTIKKGGFSALQVLQVVTATSETAFTTTSATYQTSNCAASITPNSTSSNIIVLAYGVLRNNAPNASGVVASLFRGATQFSTTAMQRFQGATNTANTLVPCSFHIYDSPASTSSTTYSIKVANLDGATTVGFGNADKSVMTLIEVL